VVVGGKRSSGSLQGLVLLLRRQLLLRSVLAAAAAEIRFGGGGDLEGLDGQGVAALRVGRQLVRSNAYHENWWQGGAR
jgi:hypothetical protein